MISDLLNNGMRLPQKARWVEYHSCYVGDHDSIQLQEQSMAGPSAVLLMDGKPLVVCGIVKISNKVGEAWTIIDKTNAQDHPLLLTRAVAQAIDITVKAEGLHRVQMTVHSEQNDAVRWAFALGFTVEALMRKYGDDQSDHFLFVRV